MKSYSFDDATITIGGIEFQPTSAVFSHADEPAGLAPAPMPQGVTGDGDDRVPIAATFEAEAGDFDWDAFLRLVDEHRLPTPQCWVEHFNWKGAERYPIGGPVPPGMTDNGDGTMSPVAHWEHERWFRRADMLERDGNVELVFGNWEVDVFDELYIDLGGPGA